MKESLAMDQRRVSRLHRLIDYVIAAARGQGVAKAMLYSSWTECMAIRALSKSR